jgi:hypothetical protein
VKPRDHLHLGWRKGSRHQAARRRCYRFTDLSLAVNCVYIRGWDPLGDDTRFEKIVEESNKPVTLN